MPTKFGSSAFREVANEYPEHAEKIMQAVNGLPFGIAICLFREAISNLEFISHTIIFFQDEKE